VEHFGRNIPGFFTFPHLYSHMVKMYPSGSHFVEVGSWFGRSTVFMAVEIVNSGKHIRLDAVDTWESDWVPETSLSAGTLEYEAMMKKHNVFDEFLKNIESVKHIVNPIRLESVKAAELYKDESLEFVFIDASHIYEHVFNDIRAWFPKVKQGGHIAGHDYQGFDVRRAVGKFFGELGKEFYAEEKADFTVDFGVISDQGIWSYFKVGA